EGSSGTLVAGSIAEAAGNAGLTTAGRSCAWPTSESQPRQHALAIESSNRRAREAAAVPRHWGTEIFILSDEHRFRWKTNRPDHISVHPSSQQHSSVIYASPKHLLLQSSCYSRLNDPLESPHARILAGKRDTSRKRLQACEVWLQAPSP